MLVGKIAGVRIRVNLFFLLLCAAYTALGLGWEILFIFVSVLVHEIGHVVMALALGVKVAEIELLPFGGQAKIEDFTGLEPDREIYIALAGPAVSLSLAGIFYFLRPDMASSYLPLFININLFLGIFNLCPALPLDGGRIMRAFLSAKIGYKKSTTRAAILGKIIALGISLYGLYLIYYHQSGLNYLAVGTLLFWAAHREGKLLAYAFMRYLINKKRDLAKNGVLPSQQVVSQETTQLKRILEYTRPTYYLVIMVVDEGDHLVGMRTEAEVIECFLEKGPSSTLRDCY
ncbi:MAG: peptidase M50 [Firmicutes bacterium HGW-Firmicutes-15]|nr:MAG: peptidase M50 [Firmicutes bacterium HGW-Firmicutes-15]